MAYPTVSAPYGYKPVNLIGGQPYAGSTRNLPIAYNQSGAIYYGDPVVITSGFAVLPSLPVNSTNVIVGYFAGCYYTSPTTKQRLYSQYYPGSVAAGDITAIVVDDPDVVLKAAVTTTAGGTTIGSASLLTVGGNLVGGTQTGSASNGDSALSVVGSSAAGGAGRFPGPGGDHVDGSEGDRGQVGWGALPRFVVALHRGHRQGRVGRLQGLSDHGALV